MRPYSMDLRERVLADCEAGMGTEAVAKKFSVSPAWVRRLKQRRRETGEVGPRKQRHGPLPSWLDFAERLAEAVKAKPDSTLLDHKEQLGLKVCATTIATALVAMGLSLKKKLSG